MLMRGTIAKKGKRWYAVVNDGVDPATGKDRRRWVSAGTRRDDAERVLADLIQRKYEGEPVVTHKGTFGEYLTERWLPIQESQVRASTYDSYRRNIALHVMPNLGRRPLDKLTADDLDLLYAQLLKAGRKKVGGTSAGLSPKSVRNIHLMLNKALADAHRKGLVVRNVASMADGPSLKARRRDEIKAWDAEQLREFLDSVADHRLHPAFHLSAHTGMRRGEVLGLRWGDVDFVLERLSVCQALVAIAYEVDLSDVKTGAGRRTIDVDQRTLDVLRCWRITRTEENAGVEPRESDLVFTKPDGSWIHPQSFSQVLDRKVEKLDVPKISLHDLRHTHATLLLKAGVPVKVVSERLGHASAAFTMSVYQHILPGMQAEAAAKFAEIMSTERGS
jgi:integrase